VHARPDLKLRWKDFRPLPGDTAPAAATPPGTVIYAIGDIHGRHDLLALIHAGIAADAGQRPARRRVVIYLGDYVSRGTDSRRVVEGIRNLGLKDCEVVTLKGNHEDLLLRYLDGELEAGKHWLDFGGLDTLADYGVMAADRHARDDETVEFLRQRFIEAMPADHLDFFRTLKVSHSEGGYFFVHGGIRPGVAFEDQDDYDQMWIREPFLESDAEHGAVVVHGHSIAVNPEVKRNRIGIDTGAYESGVLTCLVLDGLERAFLQTQ
jgi:serine/threonine protein phosphatase 1